jgi:hypothetical protein
MPRAASSSAAALPAAASPCVDVWTDAGERVTLGPSEFVASGGEGDVYRIGDRGFKLAHEPARACPPAKIAELVRIADPCVLAPRGSLHRRSGRRRVTVGHELPFVADAFTASELVPLVFRRRHGLEPTVVPALVAALRQRVAAVHAAGCLVVDLSEANVLVTCDFRAACLIDADSFQTPSFPATAIVPTVRDPSRPAGAFDERTDWFSFAVVAFSLLVGIHPYRGKHPRVHGLEARMKAGISVFDPAVKVPRACLPVGSIPEPWRGWLERVLQHGERTAPPVPCGGVLSLLAGAQPRALAASLRMIEVARLPAEVRGLLESHGRLVIHAGDRVTVDGQERLRCRGALALGASPHGRPVAAWVEGGMLRLHDLDSGSPLPCRAAARAVTSVRGTLYAACGDEIARVELLVVGDRLVAGLRRAVTVAPQSSRLWRGCVIQQLLGAATVSLLSETGAAEQRRVPELDGLTVVDAVHERGVLVAVVARGGAHERLVIRFSPRGGHHVLRQADLPAHAAQLVVLDTGVCVSLDADDRLELLPRDPAAPGGPHHVDDPAVGGDWLLHAGDGRLLAAIGRAVFEVTMRRRTG